MKPLLIALIFMIASVASANSSSNTVCSKTNTVSVTVTNSHSVTGTTAGKSDAYTGATRKNKKQK